MYSQEGYKLEDEEFLVGESDGSGFSVGQAGVGDKASPSPVISYKKKAAVQKKPAKDRIRLGYHAFVRNSDVLDPAVI